jgi:BASS family bile acid:Na+ symporter
MLNKFNQLFPIWAIFLSFSAFYLSDLLQPFADAIVPLLGAIMFIMGLNLRKQDFLRIIEEPLPVVVGVFIQFLLMPILALTLSLMLQLSNQLTAGMVLVGSCAGGTASNVICYLAKGELALSISMTLATTLLGIIVTPALCTFYLSETITVDTLGMLLSMLQIVLLPVLAGSLVAHFAPDFITKLEPALPSCAIILILLVIMIIVALNASSMIDIGPLVLAAVILHNLGGLAGGFFISRLFGFSIRRSQTIAIEVGMQNSGLGVALAMQYFSATAALPGALFSIWHNISGSLLASYWRRNRSSLEYILRDQEHSTSPPKN